MCSAKRASKPASQAGHQVFFFFFLAQIEEHQLQGSGSSFLLRHLL
jgi:hypothetical protein